LRSPPSSLGCRPLRRASWISRTPGRRRWDASCRAQLATTSSRAASADGLHLVPPPACGRGSRSFGRLAGCATAGRARGSVRAECCRIGAGAPAEPLTRSLPGGREVLARAPSAVRSLDRPIRETRGVPPPSTFPLLARTPSSPNNWRLPAGPRSCPAKGQSRRLRPRAPPSGTGPYRVAKKAPLTRFTACRLGFRKTAFSASPSPGRSPGRVPPTRSPSRFFRSPI